MDKAVNTGIVLSAKVGDYDYQFSIALIDLKPVTTHNCLSNGEGGLQMNIGCKRVQPHESVLAERKNADTSKNAYKDRVLPWEDGADIKAPISTTTMNIKVNRVTVEKSVQMPKKIIDMKSKDQDKAIKEYVLGIYAPGTTVQIEDTDPDWYQYDPNKKKKKIEAKNVEVDDGAGVLPLDAEVAADVGEGGQMITSVGIKPRSIKVIAKTPDDANVSVETLCTRSTMFHNAVHVMLNSSRTIPTALSDGTSFPVLKERADNAWKDMAKRLHAVKPHPRQENPDKITKWYTDHAEAIESAVDNGSNPYEAIKDTLLGDNPKAGLLVVHNPHPHGRADELLHQMENAPDDFDPTEHPTVYTSAALVEKFEEAEFVNLKFLFRVVHLASELESIKNKALTTSLTPIDEGGNAELVSAKFKLSVLGAFFGNVPKCLAKALYTSVDRIPFMINVAMPLTLKGVDLEDLWANELHFSVLDILKKRALRVSEEWVYSKVCDGGSFPSFDDEEDYTNEYDAFKRDGESTLPPYNNFSTNHFVNCMTSGFDTKQKLEKTFEKIKKENNDGLKLYYAVIPFCDYDPSKYPASIKGTKYTNADREAFLDELIANTDDKTGNGFFASCKGGIWAFVA